MLNDNKYITPVYIGIEIESRSTWKIARPLYIAPSSRQRYMMSSIFAHSDIMCKRIRSRIAFLTNEQCDSWRNDNAKN